MKTIFTVLLIFIGASFCFSQTTNSSSFEIISVDANTARLNSNTNITNQNTEDNSIYSIARINNIINSSNNLLIGDGDILEKEQQVTSNTVPKNLSTVDPN